MKYWRLVFRIARHAEESQDSKTLKHDISTFMRVSETYEVQCLGIRMLGVDFFAEDHEFNHIMRLLKILEARYRLSIMQFGELYGKEAAGMTIKIGSNPAMKVA